jgi:hypothetical protein
MESDRKRVPRPIDLAGRGTKRKKENKHCEPETISSPYACTYYRFSGVDTLGIYKPAQGQPTDHTGWPLPVSTQLAASPPQPAELALIREYGPQGFWSRPLQKVHHRSLNSAPPVR